jgi:predicted GIY-YIG superfamily endonuclease
MTKTTANQTPEHATGKGAEWTAKHPPKRLVHWEEFDSEEAAVNREKELKSGYGRKWLEREIKAGRTRQAGEPASVLLERIKAEKAAQAKSDKSSKRTKRKKTA